MKKLIRLSTGLASSLLQSVACIKLAEKCDPLVRHDVQASLADIRPTGFSSMTNFRPAAFSSITNFRPAAFSSMTNFRPSAEARPAAFSSMTNFRPV